LTIAEYREAVAKAKVKEGIAAFRSVCVRVFYRFVQHLGALSD
jgi:hypothetical protein